MLGAALTAATASRWFKPVAIALAIGVVFAAGGLGLWRFGVVLDRLIEKAAAAARVERDAHWAAELARANAAIQQARADQAVAAAQAEARIREGEQRLQTELKDLEKANAALAGGDRCGLERDRVRLLDGAR